MARAVRQERQRLRAEAREQGLRGRERKRHVRRGVRGWREEQRAIGREAGAEAAAPVNLTAPGGKAGWSKVPSMKQQRRTFKEQGLEGPALKKAMGAYRKETKTERAAWRGGKKGLPMGRIRRHELGREQLGYDEVREPYEEEMLGRFEETAGPGGEGGWMDPYLRFGERPGWEEYSRYGLEEATPEVDPRTGQAPTVGRLTEYAAGAPTEADLMRERQTMMDPMTAYARERLEEPGLTTEEEAAIRGRERGQVEAASAETMRQQGQALQAAGIDPRSGIASQRALQVQRGRERGLADVERGITLADLARQQQTEQLGLGVTGVEEAARARDVGAQAARRAQYENVLAGTAGLEAGERRFDVTSGLQGQQMYQNLLGDIARLQEAGRQYDVNAEMARQQALESKLSQLAQFEQQRWQDLLQYTEGGRQAGMARRAYQEAMGELEPSSLDYASAVMGGLFGGGR